MITPTPSPWPITPNPLQEAVNMEFRRTKDSPYEHLTPQVSAAESTTRLQMILGSVTHPDMAELIMHVICRAEELGIERGKKIGARR